MATQELDTARAEEFAGDLLGILNGGYLTLGISIGQRTGLFDAMAGLPPSTSAEIAEAARCDERYVREWLAVMTTGGIVDHDPDGGTYSLPPEHAACLTRAAGTSNLAPLALYVPVLAQVEDSLVRCFELGGGVPYSAYPAFQLVQAEQTDRVFDAALIDRVVPLVPGLPERLWEGIDVLDLGCGKGHAANLFASAFPASRIAGYDLSDEAIAAASKEAVEMGITNVRFEVRDISRLDEPERYDLITTFDVIHDLAKPRETLRGIRRALRPGGTYLMVDIRASSNLHENLDHPLGPALYMTSLAHCMTVSLAQGGEGLGTMWGEQKARELLAEAGFERVSLEEVEGDIVNNYYVAGVD
jgi:2-polyprenyl-3-methyl-5-hydroxy-6-metoxy-1,4-benzoquinol methylase